MQKRAKLYGRITLARYTLYEGGKRLTKKICSMWNKTSQNRNKNRCTSWLTEKLAFWYFIFKVSNYNRFIGLTWKRIYFGKQRICFLKFDVNRKKKDAYIFIIFETLKKLDRFLDIIYQSILHLECLWYILKMKF